MNYISENRKKSTYEFYSRIDENTIDRKIKERIEEEEEKSSKEVQSV